MIEEQEPNSSVTSPFATGGGGAEFEKQVYAHYLGLLLLEETPFGLPGGVTKQVEAQRASQDEPLDDVILRAELPAGEAKLALQVKHDLTFGEKNETFQKVVTAAWETFSGDFVVGRDRMGFVVGLYSKRADEHYQTVLTWARNSASAEDFFARTGTARLSSQHQRNFVSLIQRRLDDAAGRQVTDQECWDFLRSLVLLRFDVLKEPSHNRANMVRALRGLLPAAERDRASDLLERLIAYAGESSRTAGSMAAATLRQRLQAEGFALEPAPDIREDLRRLHDHAVHVLADIGTRIGTVELDRVEVAASAMEALQESRLLVLTGPPGAGKSAIMKALVDHEQAHGPTLVLSHDRITEGGWEAFAAGLGLERRLSELLVALGSHRNPAIFIDSVDRIMDGGPRHVVKDLLRSIVALEAGVETPPSWRIVLTAREAELPLVKDWLDLAAFGEQTTLTVPELNDAELQEVADRLPHLAPLMGDERLGPVIRNPLLLSLLADRRISASGEDPPAVATEIEVSRAWWDRVVGSGGPAGQARRLGLLALGEQAVRTPARRLPPRGIDVEALHSLEQDGVLRRDPGRDVFRFGHDVLEEWVLYRTLDHHRDELPEYLHESGQPLGLLRGVQLLGCFLLERGETDQWTRMLRAVEAEHGLAPRWRQALLTAPLTSIRAGELLDLVGDVLLQDDGRRLRALLVSLRTSEVMPNPLLRPAVDAVADDPLEKQSLLLGIPLPQWRVWLPVLDWVLVRADELPRGLRPEITQAMLVWQRSTPPGFPLRERIARVALAWLQEAEAR